MPLATNRRLYYIKSTVIHRDIYISLAFVHMQNRLNVLSFLSSSSSSYYYFLQISITVRLPLSLQFFCLNARTASLGTIAVYIFSRFVLCASVCLAFHFGASSISLRYYPFHLMNNKQRFRFADAFTFLDKFSYPFTIIR